MRRSMNTPLVHASCIRIMSMNKDSVRLECDQISKRVCKPGIRGIRIIVAGGQGLLPTDFALSLSGEDTQHTQSHEWDGVGGSNFHAWHPHILSRGRDTTFSSHHCLFISGLSFWHRPKERGAKTVSSPTGKTASVFIIPVATREQK